MRTGSAQNHRNKVKNGSLLGQTAIKLQDRGERLNIPQQGCVFDDRVFDKTCDWLCLYNRRACLVIRGRASIKIHSTAGLDG